MARRKATLYEQTLNAASKELGRSKDDWSVERLASLRLMLAVARHKWSGTQASSVGREMLDVMGEISALLKEVKPQEELRIDVNFVSGVRGIYRCSCCGEENTLEDGSYEPAEGGRRRDFVAAPATPPAPVAAPSTPTPAAVPAAPVLVVDNAAPLIDFFSPTRTHRGDTYNPFGSEYHPLPTPGK
jgi:hypothetical protein